MKNLKEKFSTKINFVKPLYRKVIPKPKLNIKRFVTIDIDNKEKLCGDGANVTGKVSGGTSNAFKEFRKKTIDRYDIVLPGSCQTNIKADFHATATKNKCITRGVEVKKIKQKHTNMLGIVESKDFTTGHKLPETWLRVYPARRLRRESACSVAFRWFACQAGLATFLIFWTLLWVLVIHYFEEPYEKQTSIEFKNAQNQLVIDLATALRQITPVSPKWRAAIERQLEKERDLTVAAAGRGVHLHPGHFWDLPGSFLFAIYVMTTLGFGAPVPQTLCGRTATLTYAIVAVPTHICLMIQLSTCVVVRVECSMERLRQCLEERDRPPYSPPNSDNTESANCSRNSELKTNGKLRKRILCVLGVACAGRGVPLAALLYYVLGLAAFGIARSKQPLEVLMFPLEFTTTGGLEQVAGSVRVLYGVYVEGAMALVASALATLRRRSSARVARFAARYRLFASEDQFTT